MVEASFDLIAARCSDMFVVLDHEATAIEQSLGARSYSRVQGDGGAPMFESVRVGLLAVAAARGGASVLLHPADHPAVDSETVRRVVAESVRCLGRAIVPRCGDRGGHPVLIPATLQPRIVAYSGEGGLRGFWRANPACMHALAVDDQAMTVDVDTQKQYDHLGGR